MIPTPTGWPMPVRWPRDPSPFAPVALKLAEAGVNRFPEAGWIRYHLGLVHYRAGRYEQAIERLDESMKVDPDWDALALTLPLLAMAHHRLGHAEEAQEVAGEGARHAGRRGPRHPAGAKVQPGDALVGSRGVRVPAPRGRRTGLAAFF